MGISPWKAREIRVGKYTVKVYDIRPDLPEEIVRTLIPVVMVQGWLEVPESHRKHIEWLAAHGYRVISIDTPHGLPLSVRASAGEYVIELQKAETFVAVMEAMGISRYDLIGRSEGAIVALLIARHYRARVRNVVLENPAGVIGKDRLHFFFGRWLFDKRQSLLNEEGDPKPYAPVPAGSVYKRKRWRSIKALWAVIHSDMREALIANKQSGIKTAIIYTKGDQLFPPWLIKNNTCGLADWRYLLDGSHTSYFSHHEKFAQGMATALDYLQKLS